MRQDIVTIRQATLNDVPDLVQLRRVMFESMGINEPELLDAADQAATAAVWNWWPCPDGAP